MLKAVLGVGPDDLDKAALERLIKGARSETQVLEYKGELSLSTDAEKREAVKDVVAMANGGGGVLLFGVTEDAAAADGVPATLVGVSPDLTSTLEQLIADRIRPRLTAVIHAVEVGEGAAVLVVDIEAPNRPYADVSRGRYRYPRRIGTQTKDMDEAEIALLYEGRFTRADSLRWRLRDLVKETERPELEVALGHLQGDHLVSSTPYPRVVIAAALETPPGRLFTTSRSAILDRIRNLRLTSILDQRVVGENLRPTFRGVEILQAFDNETVQRDGWAAFYDDGGFVRALPAEVNREGEPAPPTFPGEWLALQVIAAFQAYGALLEEFGAGGTAAVRLEIPDKNLPAALILDRRSRHGGSLFASQPRAADYVISTHDLARPGDLLRATAAILHDLFAAFDADGCGLLSEDGEFRPNWLGSARPVAERWAATNDVSVGL